MPVSKLNGRENPHQWVTCGEHGCKFPAWLTLCPLCRYGEDYLESKVRDVVPVQVIPS